MGRRRGDEEAGRSPPSGSGVEAVAGHRIQDADQPEGSIHELPLMAKNAGTEVARIWSVMTPTPGVKAEPAISGAEQTQIRPRAAYQDS
jgi:hypothetical protein